MGRFFYIEAMHQTYYEYYVLFYPGEGAGGGVVIGRLPILSVARKTGQGKSYRPPNRRVTLVRRRHTVRRCT